ncbi:MAG: hypothetical protein VKJ64_15225, partial [Leptolyngbyaceae bacterium]|nr:hypothetical protein [Leptolyngbyaceae bacterium]
PNPSPRAGEGLSTQEPGLKSLLPLWEKGFRDEGKSFVSQSDQEFTWAKVKQDFALQTVEGNPFIGNIPVVQPTSLLTETLKRNIPWAIAVGNKKARSERIINPILLEVKDHLHGQVSLFSGEEFNIDPTTGLMGTCDFIISQSPEQLALEAPMLVVVEAKKDDLKQGMGQCLAEMVAAQRFNAKHERPILEVYGTVTTGTVWRFLRLEGNVVTVDLTDYPVPPIERVLRMLVWIAQGSSG